MADAFSFPLERIRSALATREGAAAAWSHSPNSTTAKALKKAHDELNYRLEQLWATLPDEKRAEVEARGVRRMASV